MNWWFIAASFLIAILTAISLKYPLINDITTDYKDPPPIGRDGSFEGGEASLIRYPEEFSSTQAKYYPDVRPLKLRVSAEAALELIHKLAAERPNIRVSSKHPSRPIILLEATTPVFRFKDDVSIRVEEKASHCLIHFRSRSRVGLGDLGANARRILELQESLEALVENIGPTIESKMVR